MSNINFSVPELVNKSAWIDYRDKYAGGHGWRGDLNAVNIKYLVIHHSAGSKTGDADKDISAIASNHINTRGWGGIGYHFVITSQEVNGFAKVGYVGDIGSIRAHAPNLKGSFGLPERHGNEYLLGICIVGDFSNSIPTDAQLRSTNLLCNQLIFKDGKFPNIKGWDNVKSHKDFDSTSCPGMFDSFRDKIASAQSTVATGNDYESMLAEARGWNDKVGEKYGQKILNVIDDRPVTRKDLIIAMHRYTKYLQQSKSV